MSRQCLHSSSVCNCTFIDNYSHIHSPPTPPSAHAHTHSDEINKAYKHLAVLLHPDKNLSPGSDEAFKAIARAREELLKNR